VTAAARTLCAWGNVEAVEASAVAWRAEAESEFPALGKGAWRLALGGPSGDDVVYWYSFSNHYTKRAFTQP